MVSCMLCGSSTNDELKFGELLSFETVTVHYFCLLFAPGLFQRGQEDEGIRGFLIKDIQKECRRVKRLICCFCSEKQANLGCCIKVCHRSYHFSCALQNSVSFEFIGKFPSYCIEHLKYEQKEKPKAKDTCSICMEKIGKKSRPILIPCCKNSWFHHDCLQRFANTSGVYFKCPLCNDKDQCHSELPKLGFFLPVKDADWEYDMEAYQESEDDLEKICDAENCFVSNQTYFDPSLCLWRNCSTCGSNAIHEFCIIEPDADFICLSCVEILGRQKTPQKAAEPVAFPKIEPVKKFESWFSDDEPCSDAYEPNDSLLNSRKRRAGEDCRLESSEKKPQVKRGKRFL